ncbi:MAG: AAA domain-containing protein [Schwartzia succinivorans]|nr:AAA domain-containing protein [Schwartzia succinivorans]
MENLVRNADKVLDFWITMENLQQDEFPIETKWFSMPKGGEKRFSYKKTINWDEDLFCFFDELNESFSFSAHGNPTFFIGKPDLEPCLYELASCLNQNYQPVEHNKGKIAIFAITLSSNFCSVESVSFSPILREICIKKEINLEDESFMKSDLQKILDKYLEKISAFNFKQEKEKPEEMRFFFSISVFKKYLVNIINSVLDPWYENRKGSSLGQNPVILMDCMLYDTEETMNASEEPQTPGLSNNFFSEDLKVLRSCIQNDKGFMESTMGAVILKYILSFSTAMDFSDRRTDIIPRLTESVAAGSPLCSVMDSVLSPTMAPLGKWPGRYMPVLMQEMAINAYTGRFLGQDGRMFSVNGPPGTGKTTLLKEIIADHIVERAKLLAEIENPDDIFNVLSFRKPGGYDDYTKKYAAFKPDFDDIHNYSVLITSSNNKAVENISKELPQVKSVLESFDDVEKSSLHSNIIEGFVRTRDLFTKNMGEDTIPCRIYVKSEKGDRQKERVLKDFPDIYFSRYADQLLDGKEGDAWGLVSCALGKKENIKKFSNVLLKILTEMFAGKDNLYAIHATRYQAARNEFIEQYKKTKHLQQSLEATYQEYKKKYDKWDFIVKKTCSLRLSIQSGEEKLYELEESLKKDKIVLHLLECKLDSIKESLSKQATFVKDVIKQHLAEQKYDVDSLLEQINVVRSKLSACNLSLEQQELDMRAIDCDISEGQKMRQHLIDTMPNSFLAFLSSAKKSRREESQVKILELEQTEIRLEKQKIEHEQETLNLKQQFLHLTDEVTKLQNQIDKKQSSVSKIETALDNEACWSSISALHENEAISKYANLKEQEKEAIKSIQKSKDKTGLLEYMLEKQRQSIADLKQVLESLEREKADIQYEFEHESPVRNENAPNRFTALTFSFFQKLVSEDIEDSTWAQCQNPWITEEFNREREKLFRFALRVHREFILSSKQCRNNLALLCNVWNEKTRLIPEDNILVTQELFRTLWLLVPVISTTFASVGRFFQNAKVQGLFGTLVVDEAGQASPQMAVGALYRARRAIIVGDPKQVEPVVTDALEIIRKSYTDPLLDPYLAKTLSVQQFADKLNPLGTYLQGINGEPEWVGCPLIVHRRCINPMYSISNDLSYDGIMKLKTQSPSQKKTDTFIHNESTWFDIKGREDGGKGNHFVKAQGDFVLKLLEVAFRRSEFPSLYIISPFKSVAEGIKDYVKKHAGDELNSHSEFSRWVDGDASSAQIGTVHTFQGKEANEVIFLLGCDKDAGGAIAWVNANIVNVAATRAKYRLYVIGDKDIWLKSQCVSFMLDYLKVTLVEEGFSSKEKVRAEKQAGNYSRIIIKNEEIKTYFRHALGLVSGKPGAVEELDIISPWISTKIIYDEDPINGYDLKSSFKKLLDNNVTIKIIYGIAFNGNKEQRERWEKTEACANKLREWFGAYPNFKIKKANTHRKIFICDNRFYVMSSMNILSNKGDFWKSDSWSEGGEASGDQTLIEVYRQKDFDF